MPTIRWRSYFALLLLTLSAGMLHGAPLHFAPQRQWLTVPNFSPATGQVGAADVNGDGKADLVIYNNATGTAWVALSNGTMFAAPKQWAAGLPRSTSTLQFALADVNGDKKADFVVFVHGNGLTEGSANVFVALSTGTNFVYGNPAVWNSGFCITEQVCKLADINGDGKADLLAFTPKTGLVWVSLSTGASFGANAIRDNFFCITNEVCDTADVGGSGHFGLLDFKPKAAGGQKGNVLIAPPVGNGFGPVRYGHGLFCIDNEKCLSGDLNGDRRTDILLVKGFGAPRLEVLVALSDGQRFVNANPFSWANPTNANRDSAFPGFYLADFNGDGKADLLQLDELRAFHAGGGQTNISALYWVYLTTDKVTPTPPTPPAPPSSGVKQVNVYNCETSQDRLYYWIHDLTANTQTSQGPIDAMYSASGTCPDPQDSPVSIPLQTNHSYEIIAVDPNAIGCEGRNDPDILACRRDDAVLLGNSAGPLFQWIIPSR